MGVLHEVEVTLQDSLNRTVVGSFFIERLPNGGIATPSPTPNATIYIAEKDPTGAVSYVIAVVLIYGLSIVFLIGSHVFIKKKEEHIEVEMKKVDEFLDQTYALQDKSIRDAYKKLKKSIVPMVAQSQARHLISRRKSFLPFLASAGIHLADPAGILSGLRMNGANEQVGDQKNLLGVPTAIGSRRCSMGSTIQGLR